MTELAPLGLFRGEPSVWRLAKTIGRERIPWAEGVALIAGAVWLACGAAIGWRLRLSAPASILCVAGFYSSWFCGSALFYAGLLRRSKTRAGWMDEIGLTEYDRASIAAAFHLATWKLAWTWGATALATIAGLVLAVGRPYGVPFAKWTATAAPWLIGYGALALLWTAAGATIALGFAMLGEDRAAEPSGVARDAWGGFGCGAAAPCVLLFAELAGRLGRLAGMLAFGMSFGGIARPISLEAVAAISGAAALAVGVAMVRGAIRSDDAALAPRPSAPRSGGPNDAGFWPLYLVVYRRGRRGQTLVKRGLTGAAISAVAGALAWLSAAPGNAFVDVIVAFTLPAMLPFFFLLILLYGVSVSARGGVWEDLRATPVSEKSALQAHAWAASASMLWSVSTILPGVAVMVALEGVAPTSSISAARGGVEVHLRDFAFQTAASLAVVAALCLGAWTALRMRPRAALSFWRGAPLGLLGIVGGLALALLAARWSSPGARLFAELVPGGAPRRHDAALAALIGGLAASALLASAIFPSRRPWLGRLLARRRRGAAPAASYRVATASQVAGEAAAKAA